MQVVCSAAGTHILLIQVHFQLKSGLNKQKSDKKCTWYDKALSLNLIETQLAAKKKEVKYPIRDGKKG